MEFPRIRRLLTASVSSVDGMFPFVLHGGEISRPGETAMRIVPPFQELEDGHSRLGLRLEPLTVEQFTLQGGEEFLVHGVVEAVAGRSHRGADAGFFAPFPESDRSEMAALVEMMDDRRGTKAPQVHVQGLEHQFGAQIRFHLLVLSIPIHLLL